MDLTRYSDFEELKRFTDMYSLDRQRRGQRSAALRFVESYGGQVASDDEPDEKAKDEGEDFIYPALDGLDVEQQLEVFAFMNAQGFTPAGRGAGGRFQRRLGGRGQPSGGPARDMPPRGRADMTCVNCSRKGHAASKCRQPRREKSDLLCFTCNEPGHEARASPSKPVVPARPVKAIEESIAPRRAVSISVVTEKPRTQQPQLGDIIRTAPARTATTANRFRPLGLGVWQDIAAEVAAEK